jgi:hypothetical protein
MEDKEKGTETNERSSTGGALRQRLRLQEDHIKVVCRVRPTNKRETGLSLGQRKSVTVLEDSETLALNTKPDPKNFCFDFGIDSSFIFAQETWTHRACSC